MVPRDKQLHFWCGYVIAVLVGAIGAPVIGILVAMIIGAAKELVYDKLLDKGTPELFDFIATAVGGAMGAAFLALVCYNS